MNTKRSLLTSCTALILCFAMLLGTTFAWFTDSATSSGNKIQSGTLKMDLSVLTEGTTDDWKSIKNEQSPLFTYQNWEPGYTDVTILKVENLGNLSLKWVARFVSEEQLSILADVIDVYVKPGATEYPADRSLSGWRNVGTLREFVNTISQTTYGYLDGHSYATLGIGLKMREGVGNEYQNLTLGEFDIRIVATQANGESDSFGDNYDEFASWPDVFSDKVSASANVITNSAGQVNSSVDIQTDDGRVTSTIPEGTLLVNGANKVTLSVAPVEDSRANVSLSDSEQMVPIDVHIDGVSNENTVAIPVSIKALLPVGLNMGNFKLYHVEDGVTNEMNLITDTLNAGHNDFTYDPATGDVTLYMASFSEVALVADNQNYWNGEYDAKWFDINAESYTIVNADQLAALSAIVGGMPISEKDGEKEFAYTDEAGNHNYNFVGKTITLKANINIGDTDSENGIVFYPIGYYNNVQSYIKVSGGDVVSNVTSFKGTFDGNGHTISNFYQNTWEMFGDYNSGYSGTPNHYKDGMGLFGYVNGGTVKNLTISNFSSDGEFTPTGCVAAYARAATFENISIVNCNPRVYNTGNGGIVGILGNNSDTPDNTAPTNFNNITVDSTNKITALWGSWDVGCGGFVGMYRGRSLVNFTDCHVAAQLDVYNDVCGNYQYYWYRYAGMVIGTVNVDYVDENGYTVPDISTVTTKDCTVHIGEWNDYYYCELVENSLASYTHDHQMSRLQQISHIGEIKSGDTWTKNGNFILINGNSKTCYHIREDANGNLYQHLHEASGTETVDGETVLKEDKQLIYLPFNQVYQGYGWGVKNIALTDQSIDGLKILDRDFAESVDKFEVVDLAPSVVVAGAPVKVGSFFKAAALLDETLVIDGKNVQVFVSPIYGTDSTASVEFVRNDNNWMEGTLTFSGVGKARITITDYEYCREATVDVEVVAENKVAITVGGNKYTADVGKTVLNQAKSFTDNNQDPNNVPYYDFLVYTKGSYTGNVVTNDRGGIAVVLDQYGFIRSINNGFDDRLYNKDNPDGTADNNFVSTNYASYAWNNDVQPGETLVIFPNDGSGTSRASFSFAYSNLRSGAVGKRLEISGLDLTFAAHECDNECRFCGSCTTDGCVFNTCTDCSGIIITNHSISDKISVAKEDLYNYDTEKLLSSHTGKFTYCTKAAVEKLKGSSFINNGFGVAFVINSRGVIIRIYDGANAKYYDEDNKHGVTGYISSNTYLSAALDSLGNNETLLFVVRTGDGSNDSIRQFLLDNRVIGASVYISGVDFDANVNASGNNNANTPWG